MATGRKFRPPRRRLAVPEQAAAIRARWGSNWRVLRQGNALLATGKVKPDEMCREYEVELRYAGRQPRVRVLTPRLEKRTDQPRIPHMYDQDRICVFHPGYRDWTPGDALANTVIPWISEWLYFYELWLATGHWLGGGEHPPRRGEHSPSSNN